jgi:hypothetical protein
MKESVKESFKQLLILPLSVLVIWLIYEHIIRSKWVLPELNYGECFLIFLAVGAIISPGYWGILSKICDRLYKEDDKSKAANKAEATKNEQ